MEEQRFFIKNGSNNIIAKEKDNYMYDVMNEIASKANANQLWEKRNPNNKTCFMIANSTPGMVLTATFEGLKVKGNYSSHS